MEQEVLSSSPGYPAIRHVEMVRSCIREAQTGCQETSLYGEGGQPCNRLPKSCLTPRACQRSTDGALNNSLEQ